MKRKMYITGGSHLDPVWLWSWREGFQANKATFKAALDRMMEYDDFVFSSTSAQFFEWIEENEPKLFEEIRQRVKEGRWILCGGWWVEPDCNVPSGESFARHSLLAQRYFQEKFGITAKIGICVDSFGHNGMIPQILKKSGMENYMFLRPMPHEKSDLPSRTFLWQSPDGSEVIGVMFASWYCNAMELPAERDALAAKIRQIARDTAYKGITPELLGMNG